MKKQEAHAKFNMSYGQVLQLADDVKLLAERDSNELKNYGVNKDYLTKFAERIEAFRNKESDAFYEGTVTGFTRDKNTVRGRLHETLSSIMVRIKNLYGQQSPEYNRFQYADSGQLSDSDYVRMIRNASKVAEVYLPLLETKGFTQDDLDKFNDSIDEFDGLLDQKFSAERARNIATQDRVLAANAMYDMVVEICDYGKDYFYSRDTSKYEDYVIYDAPAPVEDKEG